MKLLFGIILIILGLTVLTIEAVRDVRMWKLEREVLEMGRIYRGR